MVQAITRLIGKWHPHNFGRRHVVRPRTGGVKAKAEVPNWQACSRSAVRCYPGLIERKDDDALPNRNIDEDTRVGIRPCIGGVATLVDITPDESRAVFGDAVHQCKIVREIRHTRIRNLVSNATDVELRKIMTGWLLQGTTPSTISGMNSHRRMGTTRPHCHPYGCCQC